MAHAIPRFVPDYVPLDIPLDAAAIAERAVLRHPRGGVLSRLGGMATLYFRQGPAPEVRRTVNGILAGYLAAYGATISSYQRIDERRLRRWDGRGLPQCYLDTAEATDPASCHYVKMMASGEGDSDPCFARFWSHCVSAEDEGFFRPLSVIRLHVPPAVLLDAPDAFAARLADWAGRLPLVHGTAGLGALSTPGYENQYAAWWLWLEAYPALEYDAAGSYLSEVRSALRDRSGGEWKPRSSNWLTFLGPQAVEALGGAGPMRSALGPEVQVSPAGPALCLRAGPRPALGSAATGGIPEAYRQVARLIAPIRFEDYAYSVITYPDHMAPDRAARRERTLRWLRRLD